MNTAFCVLFAILAQIVAAKPALDAKEKAKAQNLLREGTALFERGDHAGALEKFQSAYGTYPSPKILFNIGEADRALARDVDALEVLQRFLSEALDAPVESRTEARRTVADLSAKLGRIAVDCRTAGAEISVDGRQVGAAPLVKPVWATPGHHQVAARHAEFLPAIEDVEVMAGRTRTFTFELRPAAKQVNLAAPLPVPAPVGPAVVPPGGPLPRESRTYSNSKGVPPMSPPSSASAMPSRTERPLLSRSSEQSDQATSNGPLYERWWFWTIIGAVSVGTVATIMLTRGHSNPDCLGITPCGSL
ncbi:MAG: PEGA domain-containing protein [Myxococcales bacterium]